MHEADNGEKKDHSSRLAHFQCHRTECEAYAIKWVIVKIDYFLHNCPFDIFTDYRSSTCLDHREFNNAKIQRW